MSLLSALQVSRNFDGVMAVDDMSFDVDADETVSIIGPNGAGKTTLFNLITGLDIPSTGEVYLDGKPLVGLRADEIALYGIARTFQHGRVFGNLSVLENVLIGAHVRRESAQSRVPLGAFVSELVNGLVPLRTRAEEARLRQEAIDILAQFGERLLPRLDEPAYSLSYANRRRLEIARALALRPRLLLLDEPTAGMNPRETQEMLELISKIRSEGLSILLIEHKLSLVMQLSRRVIVMDDGKKIAEGTPGSIRTDPRVIEAYLGRPHPGQSHFQNAPEPSIGQSLSPRGNDSEGAVR